ncbi:MAG: type II toxin-antitoxin system VapC family toxin [Sulfobacillus sp.]
MIAYLDSSALVKLYVTEPGSDRVRSLMDQADAAATSAIAYPEVRAAMARRHREGVLTAAQLADMASAITTDWGRLFVVPVGPPLALAAGGVAEMYSLRGMDAIHLATALWLRSHEEAVVFATSAVRLSTAASKAGLVVDEPWQ